MTKLRHRFLSKFSLILQFTCMIRNMVICFVYISSNIRIYQGALVSESISCKIQVASKNSQECLICQVGYILSYQTGMTCVLASSGPSTSKPGIVLDWPRTNCPALTVYEQPNITQCTCLEAYYNSNGSCSSCPNYCDDCTGATTCAV